MKVEQSPKKHVLPKGILASDLERPKYGDDFEGWGESSSFELWLIAGRFGWVIPALAIGSRGRAYAVAVGENGEGSLRGGGVTTGVTRRGAQVRCGRGPHVLEQLTVYVRKSRREALQTFLDLRHGGAVNANLTRDRRSSRIAQGKVERAQGHTSWRWDI